MDVIKYTRHAKRRMKLYNISIMDVENALNNFDEAFTTQDDTHIILKRFGERFKGMIIKIIYLIENNKKIILSAYPLKKSYKR